MAWVSPRTWTAGSTVLASWMNEIRDSLKAIGDPWTSYTPTLAGMSIGNGTVTARYVAAGKTIILSIYIAAGGTTTYSGLVTFTLPVSAVSGREQVGTIKIFTGSQDLAGVATVSSAATTLTPRVPTSNTNGALVAMSNTTTNMGTTGNLVIEFTYESA